MENCHKKRTLIVSYRLYIGLGKLAIRRRGSRVKKELLPLALHNGSAWAYIHESVGADTIKKNANNRWFVRKGPLFISANMHSVT